MVEKITSQREENALSYAEIVKNLGGQAIKVSSVKADSSYINPLDLPEE